MKRQKPDVRLLCCASMIVLSLTACSHRGGKSNLTDNGLSQSMSGGQSGNLHVSKSGSRWLKKNRGGQQSRKDTSKYDNLWDRLFDLYDLPPIEHNDIDRELEWFVNHPGYIDRVQQRAEPFLYSIVRQVEKHGIPGEIALLPVIESAFQPHAVSPANAAGIWQFIPDTGRRYGLKKSRSYDGRRDVYASTRAAIKYLKKLHTEFDGDWLLAIAAYNCGEGAVERAIQRNLSRDLPTDFWSLDLPGETRAYVPRLLAVARLFADADQYGIDLHQIPNQALFKPVKVSTQLDLALAADAADISLDKLYELNPGFKGQVADVEGSYRLFIPAEKKSADFKRELARLAQEGHLETDEMAASRTRWSDVEEPAMTPLEPSPPIAGAGRSGAAGAVERKFDFAGEPATEERPAQRNFVYAAFPKERRNRGATLDKPGSESGRQYSAEHPYPAVIEKIRTAQPAEPTNATRKTADPALRQAHYTVKHGDTLYSIARSNSMTVDELMKLNHLSRPSDLKYGRAVVVWAANVAGKPTNAHTAARPAQPTRYTVREGDTLFSISRRFKVSVADLRKWNGVNIEKRMQPGRNITILAERD